MIVNDNKKPTIGIGAHASGAVGGLLLGFIVYKGILSNLSVFRCFKYLSVVIYVGWIFYVTYVHVRCDK